MPPRAGRRDPLRLVRRLALAVVALALAGVGAAAASDLGGATGDQVGAFTTTVAACDPDGVATAFTAGYAPGAGAHAVTEVVVSDLDPSCVGQVVSVTLADPDGVALGQGSAVVGGPVTGVPTTPAPASEVARVAVLVTSP